MSGLEDFAHKACLKLLEAEALPADMFSLPRNELHQHSVVSWQVYGQLQAQTTCWL